MVLMHIIRPAAGKMRLKTRSVGICKTNRSNPVSVSRLTRMLVPKPKKAFQSPGTQIFGFVFSMALSPSADDLNSITANPIFRILRGEDPGGVRHPAED